MSLNVATLRERIRLEAGSPPITEISSAVIDEFIQDGLEKISEFALSWGVYSITTEADTQDYECEDDLIDVIFCDWSGVTTLGDLFDADFNVLFAKGPLFDVETGIYKRLISAMEKQQVRDNYDWSWREQDNKLFLLPPPTKVQSVYYIGIKLWTLNTAPSRFEKYVVWFGVLEVLRARARKKRRESGISHAGSPYPWTLADPTLQDAKALEARFDEAMRVEGRRNLLPGM